MKESLVLFIISYIVIFILYFIFFYLLGLKKKTLLNCIQIEFLRIKHNINPKNLKAKKIGIIICLIDTFIISITGVIVTLPKWNFIIQLLLGFVVLMALIYSCYEILGRILNRKRKEKK